MVDRWRVKGGVSMADNIRMFKFLVLYAQSTKDRI